MEPCACTCVCARERHRDGEQFAGQKVGVGRAEHRFDRHTQKKTIWRVMVGLKRPSKAKRPERACRPHTHPLAMRHMYKPGFVKTSIGGHSFQQQTNTPPKQTNTPPTDEHAPKTDEHAPNRRTDTREGRRGNRNALGNKQGDIKAVTPAACLNAGPRTRDTSSAMYAMKYATTKETDLIGAAQPAPVQAHLPSTRLLKDGIVMTCKPGSRVRADTGARERAPRIVSEIGVKSHCGPAAIVNIVLLLLLLVVLLLKSIFSCYSTTRWLVVYFSASSRSLPVMRYKLPSVTQLMRVI